VIVSRPSSVMEVLDGVIEYVVAGLASLTGKTSLLISVSPVIEEEILIKLKKS